MTARPSKRRDIDGARFGRAGCTLGQVEKQEHGALGIAMESDFHHVADDAFNPELFGELPRKRAARVFARLHLASREFPRPRQVRARLALGQKDATLFDDDRCRHEKRGGRRRRQGYRRKWDAGRRARTWSILTGYLRSASHLGRCMAKVKLGILVSGSGTNLQAILDATRSGVLDAEVKLVVSNQPNARALERAAESGVPTRVVSHRDFADRAAFDAELVRVLREAEVTYVVLAGFMRVLTSVMLDAFPWRVINIHPALLPAFPGIHAQRQALAYGVKVAGCTVHFVDGGTDTGPIIAQAAVPVLEADTEESLSARVLEKEHRLLVTVLAALAAGEVTVVAGDGQARPRVRLSESADLRFAEARL